MGKSPLAGIAKDVQMFASKHSPEILTGIGIAGMITTTVLAVGATPKALRLMEEKKKELETDKLTPVEVVKTTWKQYIPATITGVTSVACLIGASRVSLKRNAALATAYKLSETALVEYREKVVDTLGEKKEQIVREKVAKEKIEKNPVSKNEVYITSKGETLFYEPVSGRYFKSDIELINRAVNELNRRMLTDIFGYISLNEFYDEVGLKHTSVGDELGWNVMKGMIKLEPYPQIADNGQPCIVLDFEVTPKYGYDKNY